MRASANEQQPADEPPPDPKDLLWRDGLAILRTFTRHGDGQTRKLLGKLVDIADGDHAGLLAVIREAEIQQPDGPIAWIRATITAPLAPASGFGKPIALSACLRVP